MNEPHKPGDIVFANNTFVTDFSVFKPGDMLLVVQVRVWGLLTVLTHYGTTTVFHPTNVTTEAVAERETA